MTTATATAISTRAQSPAQPASLTGPIVLLGRFLFGLIFLMAGLNHFASQTIAYAASQGVPLASVLVPLSGAIAALGALSILFGFRARLGAWLIVLFLVGVTPLHNFWAVSDRMMHQLQMVMFMKNLAMLGSALLLTQFGAGPWSLDARREQQSN